jgi:transcriptional regulator with XRE-family HTH domain
MTNPSDLSGLEDVRKRLLLTQGGIAALLGITRQTYTNWARGKSHPRGPQRVRLQQTLLRISGLVRAGRWPAPGVRALDQRQRLARLIAEIEAASGEPYGSVYIPGEGIT